MEPLTRRQREVAALVAQGLTNREIAERLVVSERTAEGHVEQIRVRLGVRSRTQIVAWVLADRMAGTDMGETPEVRYAKSGVVDVAYQLMGSGSPDVLAFSSSVIPIDSMGDEPMLRRFHQRLAAFSRLIRFDMRGVGMSDPVVASSPPTLEQWSDDALSVLDAVGSDHAVVFAPRDTALLAISLAATHPDRVSALVILNGTARFARAPDYPIGTPAPILENFLDVQMEADAVERGLDFLAHIAPSVADDKVFRAWWNRAGHRGASPSTSRAIQGVLVWADVRPLLALLRTPTLIIHRRDNLVTRVGHGRYLAEHIAEAKYLELPGADDLYWVGETDAMLDEIETFVARVRKGPASDRVVSTALWTDVVGSRAHIAQLGDQQWRDLLDRHALAARRQLVRFRGREVKSIAGRAVATFDGPARAVSCACAIRDAGTQVGLDVRAGVHTGEVELRSDGIGGMAVHIAGLVAARADPRQVLVSGTVVDLMVGSGIATRECGQYTFEGMPGRWRLFAVEA